MWHCCRWLKDSSRLLSIASHAVYVPMYGGHSLASLQLYIYVAKKRANALIMNGIAVLGFSTLKEGMEVWELGHREY